MARRFGDGPILPQKTIKLSSRKQRLQQIQGEWTAAEIQVSFKPGVKFNVIIFGQADAYMLIYSLWDKNLIHLQEQFMVLFLDTKMQVIGYRTISMGNISCCSVDIRLLASLALHCMASFVIVAHNHPSGCLQPSATDIRLNRVIRRSLSLINVTLHDHLIITVGGWLSMREKGLL
jgi:DNA repair protein RadC